jgi:hypothetical protein
MPLLRDFMDLLEGVLERCLHGNVMLYLLQRPWIVLPAGPNNVVLLVDAEHEPSCGLEVKIGLIA